MKQPITLDLAWSSRAFNIGLAVGLIVGCIVGCLAAVAAIAYQH